MGDGFQFADIIVLAILAGFILLRLRGNLGRRIGHDGSPSAPKTKPEAKGERIIQLPNRNAPEIPDPQEDTLLLADIGNPEVASGILLIKAQDPGFSVKRFLAGARTAYEMVFDAFTRSDKQALKSLLAEDVYARFVAEIDQRQSQDTYSETTLAAIKSAQITESSVDKPMARITVKFTSDQITVMRDRQGKIIEGDPSDHAQAEDDWTFERDLRSRNPNWVIVAT